MKEKALKIIEIEFAGVVDRAGVSYINHLLNVAENARKLALKYKLNPDLVEVVGLLHDLVEDIDHWTVEKVADEFSCEVAILVDHLSKRFYEKGANRHLYISRVLSTKESIAVKIADNIHNSDFTRYEIPTKDNIEKSNRYAKEAIWLESLLLP